MAKKKLEKKIDGTTVIINAIGTENGEMKFEFTKLPQDIQAKLGPFGLGHKLGDAAAGKEGTEAEESINKVWDGLMKGDWSVRAPAAEKISTKDIAANFENLSEAEKAAAKAVLESLGIKIPGI